MKAVVVMRHGPATSGFGVADAERELTEAGVGVVRHAARGMRDLDLDLGLASPYTRARRTAELIWEELGLAAPLWIEPALACGQGPEANLAALTVAADACPDASSILVVGHMPSVAQLTAMLLPEPPRVTPFVPAGAARISFDTRVAAGAGRIEWMMRPEQLALRAR